jgi:hypothetical protein
MSSSLEYQQQHGDDHTYEANKARQSVAKLPDKVTYDRSLAFRDSPYRLLHHQQGVCGVLRMRLVEASELQRSYWSALALGPMQHFNLSKAHGPVSAYCSFSLNYVDPHAERMERQIQARRTRDERENDNKKPAAKKSSSSPKTPSVVSPLVHRDNNPVWEHCQFEMPLRKGAAGPSSDGFRVVLNVRVDEDATALENIMPGVPTGGDSRLLGLGTLDLTDLILGEDLATGQALPNVIDAWVPLSMPSRPVMPPSEEDFSLYHKDDPLQPLKPKDVPASADTAESSKESGRVRLLVSYQPHGMDPQPKDVVAMEAVARRNPHTATCRPVVPPLTPLRVMERRGTFLLCQYTARDGRGVACVRLHRNAVFVIERRSLVDAAHNLAWLPADVWMATPMGRAVGHAAGPVVAAGQQVLMPALLSFKLVWVALRTTTLASWSGVAALGSTFWNEGTQSLTINHERPAYGEGSSSFSSSSRGDRRGGGAQFVTL